MNTGNEPTVNNITGIREAACFPVTVIMGILGGIIAIPGVLLALYTTGFGSLYTFYIILIGPAVEEVLKQSGILYLLMRKPYLVARRWQFPLASLLGGFTFATLENLIYQYVFLAKLPQEQLLKTMAFRWVVCTMLHVTCSAISGLGLVRDWEYSRRTGNSFCFKYTFYYFGLAIGIHAVYNLIVTLVHR